MCLRRRVFRGMNYRGRCCIFKSSWCNLSITLPPVSSSETLSPVAATLLLVPCVVEKRDTD